MKIDLIENCKSLETTLASQSLIQYRPLRHTTSFTHTHDTQHTHNCNQIGFISAADNSIYYSVYNVVGGLMSIHSQEVNVESVFKHFRFIVTQNQY